MLFESVPHAMLMSLDDAPLDRSAMLALFAIGAGPVAMRVSADDYVVEAGELRDGEFVRIATIPAQVAQSVLRFQVDAVQSKLLLLIARRGSVEEARRRMTEALR
jgi:hypothetical protein